MEIWREKFCRRCQEPLAYLAERCPQCGAPFDANDAGTYLFRPRFLRVKFWLPGLALGILSGVISYAACLSLGNDLGFALFLAVPVSMGAIIGYSTRGSLLLLGVLVATSIVGAIATLMTFELTGFFCGMTLAVVFFVPVMAGALLGWLLRSVLKLTTWDQRWFLPVVLFMALPYGVQWIENSFPRRMEVATVRTRLHVMATADEAFRAIMFYEEIEHDPPWLVRFALPKPIRSQGSKQQVGNVVRCYYDRGWLTKRISERVESKRLAFEVVEQHLHFERDVTLLDGRFEIEPAGNGSGAEIVLTTRYARHCHPQWLWRPIEERVIHDLHWHVLAGMKREAERTTTPREIPLDKSPYEREDRSPRPALAAGR